MLVVAPLARFQFQEVQLKVMPLPVWPHANRISIPGGAIKGNQEPPIVEEDLKFQFQEVQLKDTKITICIQNTKDFNSRRCN